MRRRSWLLAVVAVLLAALGTAGWFAAPLVSPEAARARGVGRLARERYADGIARLQQYAERYPGHAQGAKEILVGRPVRLRLEFGPLGLLLDGPAVPPTARLSDVTVERGEAGGERLEQVLLDQGPRWLDATRLAYAVIHEDGRPELLTLDVLTRKYTVRELPETAMPMTFAAICGLLGSDPAVYRLQPKLGGATQPALVAVSPDASWLILRAAVSGDLPYELWRCRPTGADAQRLCALETQVQAVAFDPAGSRLAFFDGPAVKTVGLADTESRELKRYETAAVLSPAAPCWSDDGAQLAYGVAGAGQWWLVAGPAADAEKLVERPRLHRLSGLEWAGSDRLLQSQHLLDDDRRCLTLRLASDQFASRVLFEDGREATLSPRGDLLAFRAGNRVRCVLLPEPLRTLKAERLPEANLPEREAGPPAPASPAPDDAAPPPPERRTTPL